MKKISGYILENILGWKITGDFPDVKKSVIIFAPHTSYWDGFYGKLYFMNSGLNYRFLSKKELFKFPFNYLMYWYGSLKVRSNKDFINEICELYKTNTELHIVLSPEGTRKKVRKWKKGFYYIAKEALVPIIVGYIDYKRKAIGIKGTISEIDCLENTFHTINTMYWDVQGKYPENFSTDQRFIFFQTD